MASRDVPVILRLERGRLDTEALTRLKAAGLQVDRVLRRLSVVTGTVASGGVAALRQVDGVQTVEVERTVHASTPAGQA